MHVNARAIIERDIDGRRSVYLQWRAKTEEARVLELPGGSVEEYESILDALRREVFEETGMRITTIEPDGPRTIAAHADAEVECLPVFAAHQTLRGPVDSIGVYLRCHTSGDPRSSAENDTGLWIELDTLRELMANPAAVSWVDRAGLMHYLAVMS